MLPISIFHAIIEAMGPQLIDKMGSQVWSVQMPLSFMAICCAISSDSIHEGLNDKKAVGQRQSTKLKIEKIFLIVIK